MPLKNLQKLIRKWKNSGSNITTGYILHLPTI